MHTYVPCILTCIPYIYLHCVIVPERSASKKEGRRREDPRKGVCKKKRELNWIELNGREIEVCELTACFCLYIPPLFLSSISRISHHPALISQTQNEALGSLSCKKKVISSSSLSLGWNLVISFCLFCRVGGDGHEFIWTDALFFFNDRLIDWVWKIKD